MTTYRVFAGGPAVLAAALLHAAAGPAAADDKKADDLKGTWVVKSQKFDGDDVPAAVASGTSFVFDGDTVTMKGGLAQAGGKYIATSAEHTYKVKVGTADKVRTIDLAGPGDAGRTIPGIFKVEKGKLTLVLNFKDADRP